MVYASDLKSDAFGHEGSNPSTATIIYGPYTNRENRKFVVIIGPKGRKTTTYARYLIEQKIGRNLRLDETVDHIDGDKTNDNIENLQLLSRAENIRKSSKATEWFTFVCPVCGAIASKPLSKVKHNRKQGKAGPFCGKSCAGKVSVLY
jgi:hypothetical protein